MQIHLELALHVLGFSLFVSLLWVADIEGKNCVCTGHVHVSFCHYPPSMQPTVATYGVFSIVTHLQVCCSLQEAVSGFLALYCLQEGM